MIQNSDGKRIALADYLADRGLSNQSPEVCALLARIHRREQRALLRLKISNAPYHRLPEHIREVMTTHTFEDVPAMSDPKTAGEISKAARGMQADWKCLDLIELVFDEKVVGGEEPAKRTTAHVSHMAKIVRVLEQNNYAPLSLPAKENGRSIARQVAQQALVGTGRSGSLRKSQFDNTWDRALQLGELKYAADGL